MKSPNSFTFAIHVIANYEKSITFIFANYTSAIPTNSKLIYRLFNEDISNSYFCSSIPPSSPAVISEMEATGGTVQITTTAVTNTEGEVTSYTHLIVIIDLVLTNEQGESIVNPILNYGSFSTTPAP